MAYERAGTSSAGGSVDRVASVEAATGRSHGERSTREVKDRSSVGSSNVVRSEKFKATPRPAVAGDSSQIVASSPMVT